MGTKWIDKFYSYSRWIVISIFLVAYFFYQTFDMSGGIEQAIKDIHAWLNLVFSTFMQVQMVSIAYDVATEKGLDSDEFIKANELNNNIIKEVNNSYEKFKVYIRALNNHEKQSLIDDFLFSVGDKTIDELTPKELKMFKKLKPIVHNIYGFNLPLFYEATKGGKINYKSSFKKNEGKRSTQLQKALFGMMFGAMTVNMTASWSNLGTAVMNVAIVGGGLVATFLMVYIPQFRKYTHELPLKVMRKVTLYQGFKDFENGKSDIKLIVDKPKVEEVKEQLNIEETKKEE